VSWEGEARITGNERTRRVIGHTYLPIFHVMSDNEEPVENLEKNKKRVGHADISCNESVLFPCSWLMLSVRNRAQRGKAKGKKRWCPLDKKSLIEEGVRTANGSECGWYGRVGTEKKRSAQGAHKTNHISSRSQKWPAYSTQVQRQSRQFSFKNATMTTNCQTVKAVVSLSL
jgi:hypothetical protein